MFLDKYSLRRLYFLILFLLLTFGLVVFYTSSFFISLELKKNANFLFFKRLQYIVIGFIFYFIFERISLDLLRKWIFIILLATFVLMLITFFSPNISGAKRWIFINGISIQPSEILKFSLVIYLSSYLSRFNFKTDNNISYWIKPILIFGLFWILIVLQNDYSTAIYFALLFFITLFISNMPLGYIFSILFAFIPFSIAFLILKPYRIDRIIAFLNPYSDPSGKGYQIIASFNALRNGGFWGKGLGMGEIKLGKLPEASSDFIFAVLGEEFGFVGVVFCLTLFFLFLYVGYQISINAKDHYRFYIAFISSLAIFLQALMNIAIVVGVLPPTGINLPFFSSGGSSIIITMILSGLISNVSLDIEINEIKENNIS